ncbi:MAG: LacI family transcriptional regulator, partial [Erysipelotrichaceae bacterium]|nr:LacI family transcriptional regulator [Erysipelotrichaceae bacterium]
MSSIKDVAKEANVSISTVSIVINGKAKERKISEETQDKVLKAMEKLNYQPNLSAKRLRASDSRKTIALFWTTDFRGIMLSRFLTGLQNEITKSQYNYDIIIYPYKNDQLNKEDTLTKISNFHGAIIANASNKDIDFLKKLKPMVPIVLYNREVEEYS